MPMETAVATAILLVGVALLAVGCLALMARIWNRGPEEEKETQKNRGEPLT